MRKKKTSPIKNRVSNVYKHVKPDERVGLLYRSAFLTNSEKVKYLLATLKKPMYALAPEKAHRQSFLVQYFKLLAETAERCLNLFFLKNPKKALSARFLKLFDKIKPGVVNGHTTRYQGVGFRPEDPQKVILERFQHVKTERLVAASNYFKILKDNPEGPDSFETISEEVSLRIKCLFAQELERRLNTFTSEGIHTSSLEEDNNS